MNETVKLAFFHIFFRIILTLTLVFALHGFETRHGSTMSEN